MVAEGRDWSESWEQEAFRESKEGLAEDFNIYIASVYSLYPLCMRRGVHRGSHLKGYTRMSRGQDMSVQK